MSRTLVVAAVAFMAWLGALVQGQQTPADGVYTAEQAAAGQTLYRQQCAGCHSPTLGGMAGPPLRGENFLKNWSGRSLGSWSTRFRTRCRPTIPAR